MKRLSTFLLLGALLAGSGVVYGKPGLAEREWKVDGVSRAALVHVPAAATKSDTPLVFAFHGHGGSMAQAARSFGYHTQWPEAIVVYMQGLKTPGKLTDPDGKKAGWQHGAGDQMDRDLKFFDVVLKSLQSDYKVYAKRIYATGHSNGGSFTYLLWAQRGDVFAAVAPSASTPGKGYRDLKALPALHVAGETDALVKYAWQQLTINAVRKINGCDETAKPWGKSGDLVGIQYPSKTGTPFVTLISPGAHPFPREAPALIVRFFKEHVRK